jgi:hypothetical protein
VGPPPAHRVRSVDHPEGRHPEWEDRRPVVLHSLTDRPEDRRPEEHRPDLAGRRPVGRRPDLVGLHPADRRPGSEVLLPEEDRRPVEARMARRPVAHRRVDPVAPAWGFSLRVGPRGWG